MNKIYTSATRIVLILLIIWLIVLNYQQIPLNETMKYVIISVVSFYFGQKVVQSVNQNNVPNITDSTPTSEEVQSAPVDVWTPV